MEDKTKARYSGFGKNSLEFTALILVNSYLLAGKRNGTDICQNGHQDTC
ncbi:hypothetical protein NTGBS_60042 [Candidatus Nitrotoga sp. BS]|nr:hypothetical protein NTGBS_60042 [Candidatus Nitrotoga sp. BS]